MSLESLREDWELAAGDYVELTVHGGVWRIKGINPFQGLPGEDMLTLEWIGGCPDPGRTRQFSSGQARKLAAMEVIALCAT